MKAWVKLRLLCVILLSIVLSGCVHYDVGIRVIDQHHGEIVQHIRLDEQLTNFNSTLSRRWLTDIEQRTRHLGGRVKRLSQQEIVTTTPFNNGAELETKINQFFNLAVDDRTRSSLPSEIPALASHLQITQSNFLLVERNHLIFDMDLRPLGVLAADGNLLVSPGSLLDFNVSLNTPWKIREAPRTMNGSTPLIPQKRDEQDWIWTLKPGELNHLEAIFWVPSPLGIGTSIIAAIVGFGFFLRSLLFPSNSHYSTDPTLSPKESEL